jgi:hypothetical protein
MLSNIRNQHSKFAIQLNESTIGNSIIFMDYVRFYCQYLSNTVDEFILAEFLETDSKGKPIFSSLEEFFQKQNI